MELMHQTSKEMKHFTENDRYSVMLMNGQEFILTGKQVQVIKQASLNGKSNLIWFDKLAINVSSITSIEKKGVFKTLPLKEYLRQKNSELNT